MYFHKRVYVTDSHHDGLLVISHPGRTTPCKTSGPTANYHHSVIGAPVRPSNMRRLAATSTTWSPIQESTSSQMLHLKSVLSFDISSLTQRLFAALPDLRLGAAFVLPEVAGASLPFSVLVSSAAVAAAAAATGSWRPS